ncbi:MAG: L,D-transpeptidase family protein [Oscillospiraceae bacterium]|jgi:hypothetical protein|nr:L,D-transpeptidase family protein [Oscillospiraceae bacterium]
MRKRKCAAWIIAIIAMLIILASVADLPSRALTAASRSDMLIIVDTYALTLTVYENQKMIKRYPVAIGRWGMPTPLGVFRINRKHVPKNSDMGTRFLGLNAPWGVYGIHGTSNPGSIGSHASHGCIRMFNKDVEELYRLVYVGTSVIIEGSPYGELGDRLSTLNPWAQDSAVRAVQRKLIALGYYNGNADGTYGPATSRALLAFKKANGLPPIDIVDSQTYEALGLMLFE